MDLIGYLKILNRYKLVIILTTAVTVVVALVGGMILPPTYSATATLRVLTATSGSREFVNFDTFYADRLMNTYVTIATGDSVQNELREQLDLKTLPKITVEVIPTTELLLITVEADEAALAKKTANTLADILVSRGPELMTGGEQTTITPPLEGDVVQQETTPPVYVIEPALTPTSPSGPNKKLFLLMGAVVGLVGGTALAFLFNRLDTHLYTSQQITDLTGIPVRAEIPTIRSIQRTGRLFTVPPYADTFNRLKVNLLSGTEKTQFHTFLFTSAEPQSGKSLVAANFALSLARSGRNIILVDADLHHPTQHTVFDLSNTVGLANVLQQELSLDETLQTGPVSNIQVLTSGPLPPYPAEVLSLDRLSRLFEQLSECAEIVVFDAPAWLAASDAAVMASMVDDVLLVVNRKHTRQNVLTLTNQQLVQANVKPAGIIVNMAGNASDHYRQYKK